MMLRAIATETARTLVIRDEVVRQYRDLSDKLEALQSESDRLRREVLFLLNRAVDSGESNIFAWAEPLCVTADDLVGVLDGDELPDHAFCLKAAKVLLKYHEYHRQMVTDDARGTADPAVGQLDLESGATTQ